MNCVFSYQQLDEGDIEYWSQVDCGEGQVSVCMCVCECVCVCVCVYVCVCM